MKYSWQQSDWRNFSYDETKLKQLERDFLRLSGVAIGIRRSLNDENRKMVRVSFLSDEAWGTSEIEGEILDRESLQSSIQRYFNLKEPLSKNHPRENGIARMMVNLYRSFDDALSHDTLFRWHKMLMNGRTDLAAVGQYRFHSEPMQIVSGRIDKPRVHYEAPPSERVQDEMDAFVEWFNISRDQLTPLVRAGIAHLYFEHIHPFEDGNGRIGRALIEKALAQSLAQPTLIAVSQTIQGAKKVYYDALEASNSSNEVTDWLLYFGAMVLDAQQFTINSIEFLIWQTQFFDRYATQLNARQTRMLKRIFQEGLRGFTGGMSVKNYIAITKTSPATAGRDLNDLVGKGIMHRTGERKSTRYWMVGIPKHLV